MMKTLKNETILWREINDMMGGSWHASRVESHSTAAGIPDVDYCIDEIEGHMELKYGKAKILPKIRDSQLRWHAKRAAAGGTSFMLALIQCQDHDLYLMFYGTQLAGLHRNRDVKHWIDQRINIEYIDSLDRDEFIHLLKRGTLA